MCVYDFLFPCANRRADGNEAFRLLQRASAPLAAVADMLCVMVNDGDAAISETASACVLLLAQTQPDAHAAIIEAAPHLAVVLNAGGDAADKVLRALRWAVAGADPVAVGRLKQSEQLLQALNGFMRGGSAALASLASDVLKVIRA